MQQFYPSISHDRVTNLLDLIAFFMVTTDLYGKDRLSKLKGKVNSYLKEKDRGITFFAIFWLFMWLCFLFGVLFLITMFFRSFLVSYEDLNRGVGLYLGNIAGWCAAIFVVGGFIGSIVYIIVDFLKKTLIEGLLLLIGSFIFIVSRFIALYFS